MIAVDLVMLGAGLGTRMNAHISGIPKILTELTTGRSILDVNLENCRAASDGFRTLVVTGYQAAAVDDHIRTRDYSRAVRTVFNPDYARSGPLCSLNSAFRYRQASSDVLVWANGDTIFSHRVYQKVVETIESGVEGVYLICSEVNIVNDDDLVVSEVGGRVLSAVKGKRLVRDMKDVEIISAGLVVVVGSRYQIIIQDLLDQHISENDGHRSWHDVFGWLTENGLLPKLVLIGRREWKEYDTRRDVFEDADPNVVIRKSQLPVSAVENEEAA